MFNSPGLLGLFGLIKEYEVEEIGWQNTFVAWPCNRTCNIYYSPDRRYKLLCTRATKSSALSPC
jgi:hypothetical protein